MLFDETRPVKKPYSIWELRQVLDSIDERRKKLIWHRSEVAGGEYHWNNEEAKKEYYQLGKQRGKVLCLITASI
jgi:hypothetical protein